MSFFRKFHHQLPGTLVMFSLLFFAGCLGKNPEQVMQEMTSNMFEVQQMHLSSDIIFGAEDAKQNFEMTMQMESDVEYSDPDVPKSQSSFTYQTGFSNINFEVKGQSKMIDEVIYLKFDKLPGLGILGGLSRLTGEWYKIDPEEITDASLLANFGDLPFGNITNPVGVYGNITQEQRQQLKDLAARSKFFILQEKLDDEEIDGVKTYHYRVTIDQDGVREFITAADTIVGYTDTSASTNTSAVNASNVNTGLNTNSSVDSATSSETSSGQLTDLLQYIDTSNVELWIGKGDMLLRKASGTVTLTDTAGALTSFSPNVAFTFLMSQYGVPVSVEAPEDAESFQEFITDSLNSGASSSQ